MKKARAAPAEMALPPHHPYPVISEDDRAWFKLQHLKQDYEDLLKVSIPGSFCFFGFLFIILSSLSFHSDFLSKNSNI